MHPSVCSIVVVTDVNVPRLIFKEVKHNGNYSPMPFPVTVKKSVTLHEINADHYYKRRSGKFGPVNTHEQVLWAVYRYANQVKREELDVQFVLLLTNNSRFEEFAGYKPVIFQNALLVWHPPHGARNSHLSIFYKEFGLYLLKLAAQLAPELGNGLEAAVQQWQVLLNRDGALLKYCPWTPTRAKVFQYQTRFRGDGVRQFKPYSKTISR